MPAIRRTSPRDIARLLAPAQATLRPTLRLPPAHLAALSSTSALARRWPRKSARWPITMPDMPPRAAGVHALLGTVLGEAVPSHNGFTSQV